MGVARGFRIDGRDDDHLVLDRVEHDHDRRAHEHAVGDPERVGPLVGQVLDQPHGVVAHVADDAGGDRRQVGRQLDARLGQQGAQRFQRRQLVDLEGGQIGLRTPVDLGLAAEGAPDDIRGDADDRVASAHGAALHRFQQAADGLPVAQLQRRRHRRLEVGDQPRPHHLGRALAIALAEGGTRRQRLELRRGHVELGHGLLSCRRRSAAHSSVCSRPGVPSACLRAASLTERP